ncbi:gustatory receptor 8a [Bactrocera oleae]|uniref:gustatory receptor 8a n=1 Tax=Bactrocera oleae TaxID=104688 RepID=UPI00387E5936
MKQRKTTSISVQQPVRLDTFTLLLLRLGQLFGQCAVPLRGQCDLATVNQRPQPVSVCQQRFLLLWHCLHFICFFLVHLWTSVNHDSILYNSDSFGKFIDFLKLIAAIISHFVIITETILCRRHMQDFLLAYTQLHYKWHDCAGGRAEFGLYRIFVFRSSLFIVAVIIVDVAYIQEISRNRKWLTFFIPFVPSGLICNLRTVQITFFMEMLRIEVEHLNRNVERLVLFSERNCRIKFQKRDQFVQKICAELQILVECYQSIYEMSILLKKAVGISMTCNYIKDYVLILSECYWSYWMVYNGENITEYLLIIPTSVSIALLLLTSRNCMRSTNFLAHNIHKIRHDIEDYQISTRLQSFALQMLHQRIILDGFGFFVLNCDMARDILGSIATYMIFFIQFMPKFKSF